MPNAMNFNAAVTPPSYGDRTNSGQRARTPEWPGFGYRKGTPVVPKKTGNDAEFNALMGIYRKNQKAYNSAKVGKTYKESYIKSGPGYVKPDFGEGSRGAAIPYTVAQRNNTRLSSKIAETEVEAKSRKAKEAAESAAAKAKKEAIKRRQKKK